MVACYLKWALVASSDWAYLEKLAICACSSTCLSCAGVLPQRLAIDFEINLWLFSRIVFRSDCQMTGRGLNLDSKLDLCSLTDVLYRFHLLRNPWINCVEFEFFVGLLIQCWRCRNWGLLWVVSYPQPLGCCVWQGEKCTHPFALKCWNIWHAVPWVKTLTKQLLA